MCTIENDSNICIKLYKENTLHCYIFENKKLIMYKIYKYEQVEKLNKKNEHLHDMHLIADSFKLSEFLSTKVFPQLRELPNSDKSNIPCKDSNMTILYDIIEEYRTNSQKQKNIISLIESLDNNIGYLKLIETNENNQSKYMKLIKHDQSNIHVFYDIKNTNIIKKDNIKTHLNINGSYIDCIETKNNKGELEFYVIDTYSLYNQLNDAKITYIGTAYHRDGYRGIYFEYLKPNGNKTAVFCYCNKRSRNIYHISYYFTNDNNELCQCSFAAVRDYKDIDRISTLQITSKFDIENSPFYSDYLKNI